MPYSDYLRILASLVGLFVLLFIMLRVSSMLRGKKFSGEIKVVDRYTVDTGVTLMIVDIRGDEMLLSVSGKSVKVLKEYT